MTTETAHAEFLERLDARDQLNDDISTKQAIYVLADFAADVEVSYQDVDAARTVGQVARTTSMLMGNGGISISAAERIYQTLRTEAALIAMSAAMAS